MKDRACVDDGNKTTSDELQHVPTLDSRKHDKCIVIEWLLGKYHCTYNRSDCLNLFIFEMTSEWCFDDSRVQGIQAFKTLSITLWLNRGKSFLRINLKKFGSSGCPDKNTISMRNQIIKGIHNLCRFHTVFQLDITSRGNINMCGGEFREHFGYSTLWLTCNDQLEHLQVVGLNLMLKCVQEAPLRLLHSSNTFITITGSSSHETSSRLDNGVVMT